MSDKEYHNRLQDILKRIHAAHMEGLYSPTPDDIPTLQAQIEQYEQRIRDLRALMERIQRENEAGS